MDVKNINTIIVHAGIFHADDVFTVAYLQYCRKVLGLQPLKVIRSFKVFPYQTLENGFLVADIGNGPYDHHFPESKKQHRSDGQAYAAFGLVVRDFHDGILTNDEYTMLDKQFISPMDYNDNNGGFNMLAYSVSVYNLTWDDETSDSDDYKRKSDVQFMQAVKTFGKILERVIYNVKSSARAKGLADNAAVEGTTIYLDKFAPIAQYCSSREDVDFIGSPSLRGGYQIISVKGTDGNNKKLFPENIRGYNPGHDIYNEDGMMFCHPSGFMSTFVNKDMAKKYMDKNM